MKRMGWVFLGLGLVIMPAVFLAITGCEIGSADSVVRTVTIDFTGYYEGNIQDGDTAYLTSRNSGARVRYMMLRQNGDQLEAIDNNQLVFRGTLGNVIESTATFTLEGSTTVGNPVTISGSLSETGERTSTIQGTWIEPEFYAIFSGRGTINPSPTNQPSQLTLNTSSTSIKTNATVTLMASGASRYDWSASGSASGNLASTSTSTGNNSWSSTGSAGTVTITVRDADNTSRTASVTITVTN